jgi:succinyl-CoA---D-citramalate CoA-transferase
MASQPAGPLDGVRVLELGTLLAGPFAARLLADLGAEVIKVEAPDRPDPVREWGSGSVRGRRLWWPTHGRNKKCVTLDLRLPEGQALCLRLVERCDAVIENFRPGTLERWNLGYERLREARPGLVLVRISGYGQDGPYRDRAGYASVAEAMSGLRYLTGFPGEPPPRLGVSLGDSLGALFAVQGLLAALYQRDALGGAGQVVDVSLVESCFALVESVPAEYAALGHVRQPAGTRLDGIAPSNIFRSRDGRWVVIAANQDTVFARLCSAMGRPELSADERFVDHRARGEHQDELESIVGEWAARYDARELDRILNEAGVVAGPVYTIEDVFADPHFRARQMIVDHEDPEIGPVAGPNVAPRFSRTPGSVRWSGPPQPGAHNGEIYGELVGLDEAELRELKRAGVI